MANWFARLRDDLDAPPSGPVFSWRWVVVPLVVLAALTAFARLTEFDLRMEQLIYQAGGNSWALGEKHPFWLALYRYGTIPAAVVVLLSILGYVGSWKKQPLRRWRRVFLYLIVCAIVGPGIISNAGLKEYWGRPRPREIQGLGGHSHFEKILSFDGSSDGKSFPCGHATMGFYFVCGFFLLRNHRRKLAEWILLGGIVLGTFMGIARMAQGAHFFSDVVWAGAVCYFSSLGLYFALGLHRGLIRRGLKSGKMPLWLSATMGILTIGLIVAILLASPYQNRRHFFIVNDFAKTGPLEVLLIFTVGEVEIDQGERLLIEGEAYGHGVPTSKIGAQYVEWEREGFSAIWYMERFSGWFTEVNEQLQVELPWDRVRKLKIRTGNANVWIDMDKTGTDTSIQIFSGTGTVFLHPRGRRIKLVGAKNAKVTGTVNEPKRVGKQLRCRLVVDPDFSGTIAIADPEEATGPDIDAESANPE